jgi:hypothetical protein
VHGAEYFHGKILEDSKMGYNARNDEIHENLEPMRREREAYEDALAIVRQFNAHLSAKKTTWFWPTVAAALASKHHWLIMRAMPATR